MFALLITCGWNDLSGYIYYAVFMFVIIFLCYLQDAASPGITIMKRKLRGRVFLGCDNQPLSRSLQPSSFSAHGLPN
jgi:hypothetical protein